MRLLEPFNESLRSEVDVAVEVRRQAWFTLQDAEERLSTNCNEHDLSDFHKSEREYIEAHRVYKHKEMLLNPFSVE